jgi:RHS repeat-associated protein
VASDGEVVRTATATPSLSDAWTATVHFAGGDWSALTSTGGGATSLSVAVTSTLRADAVADIPVLPAPDWAKVSEPIYSSAALPVEVRESLSTLATTIAVVAPSNTATTALYDVPSLAALGALETFGSGSTAADSARLIVTAGFQAHPFQEPLTGHDYVRRRWYDPPTGTFLSPDPLGYNDSSNLYAFAGGDPVNHRDPTGTYEADVHHVLTEYLALHAGFSMSAATTVAAADEDVDQDESTEPQANAEAGRWDVVEVNHFAIQPGEKRVRRNSPAARQRAKTANDLRSLGSGLHLLQDSYSHEDAYVGDLIDQRNKYGGIDLNGLALLPDSDKGIFHPDNPKTGSRADNHLTDETWTDPGKALEMAHTTFDVLIDYRLRHHSISQTEADALRARWARLEPIVGIFVRAKTKRAKQQWVNTFAQTVTFTKADLKDMNIK